MSWTITNLSLTREDPLNRIRRSPLSRVGRVVVGPLRISPGRSATISDATYQQFERRILEYKGAGLIRLVQKVASVHPPEETPVVLPAEETPPETTPDETETTPEETPAEETPAVRADVPVDAAGVKLPGEDEEEEEEAKPRRKTRAPKVAA